uniref:Uncharacterized protein n=4 Tax=Magallana gigas TaxID=29159 RepID=A0A8W8IJU9_MAGGI
FTAVSMETKIICLALAFLLVAMEINAVPMRRSLSSEDPWISSVDKRAKNRMIVMMSRCLRYLYEKRPPSPECMQHFMSLRPGGSPVINMS